MTQFAQVAHEEQYDPFIRDKPYALNVVRTTSHFCPSARRCWWQDL